MSRRYLSTLIIVIFLTGCASRGPVVRQAPSVQVTQFETLLFTPDVIKFQAKVVITNHMNGPLTVQKVDFSADVNDKQMFNQSFSQLKPMRAMDLQTVTFPFQIAIKDFKDQMMEILANGSVAFSFKGQVIPAGDSGLGPIPFSITRTIPLPVMPTITIEGTEGSPLNVFTVFLKIKNANPFPLHLKSMNSYVELNGTKYNLLIMQGPAEIKPGAAEVVALKMEQTAGKTVSMAFNVAQPASLKFAIGGDINCQTPYGPVYLPLKLNTEIR